MNIYTVRDNLTKTIAGKEAYVNNLRLQLPLMDMAESLSTKTTIKFVEIMLDELYGILNDVEVCCKQATETSWALNPERMGQ